jgi:D-threo-aldose 1-dehydrogenase
MSIRDKPISDPLGFGSAPPGNMFRDILEEEAAPTVDAAWQQPQSSENQQAITDSVRRK